MVNPKIHIDSSSNLFHYIINENLSVARYTLGSCKAQNQSKESIKKSHLLPPVLNIDSIVRDSLHIFFLFLMIFM